VAATGSRVIYGLRRRVSSLAREELELGQYRLVRRVGEGATGEVFVARHALLRRPTAIKLLQPRQLGADAFARCERAVQEMSQLRHPSSVAVYDFGRSPDGVFYFAMEFLDGISLAALLERYGEQPTARVIAIIVQLCGALHEAHHRGFVHGNVTPSNVILCERGGLCDLAKLTDFGLARTAATQADDLRAIAALAASLAGEGPGAREIAACFAEPDNAKALAARLRALGHDWPAAQARAWWSEFRRTSAPILHVPATLAVDLADRKM
jgi:serine/threonine-protein kinase